MRLLVTGGCGFIGSHLVRLLLGRADITHLTNLDALTYAGRRENLEDVESDSRYRFVHGNICDGDLVAELLDSGNFDAIINSAAETHVDRSIEAPAIFLQTNVGGTETLLAGALKYGVRRFVQVSTDEVYGSLGAAGKFTETTPLDPRSPYSASKASADLLVMAYHHTHQIETVITRCSNNYGPYQFPEKLIPLATTNALRDIPVPIYGDGLNVRDWLHVIDHCHGIVAALLRAAPGTIYNFGGDTEKSNIEIVEMILDLCDKPRSLMRFVTDRKGHDRRYAMDHSLATAHLAWAPQIDFVTGMQETVEWYRANTTFWS